ncbi:hypothetical protein B0H14DRAFT_3427344 [Mycena olivaceomarginata]|nr:hypothetical protein B0H14DRAFT_3427344 [Mycena olivaceomarginata]
MRVVGDQTKGMNWLRQEVASLRKQVAKAAQVSVYVFYYSDTAIASKRIDRKPKPWHSGPGFRGGCHKTKARSGSRPSTA